MGALWGRVDAPVDDLDRQVPGRSSATTSTSWRSGSDLLQMAFYDATRPTDGCTAP